MVLELTETETNYEAGFRELDKMEQTKIPVKVVSVLRRNMTTAEHKKVSGIKIYETHIYYQKFSLLLA